MRFLVGRSKLRSHANDLARSQFFHLTGKKWKFSVGGKSLPRAKTLVRYVSNLLPTFSKIGKKKGRVVVA